jgi:nucleoside-diphosphate-sugar epimerase
VQADLFEDCDAVIHLAALHGAHLTEATDRREFWTVNVGGTQAVLEAALQAGVHRFVLASSTAVYGRGSPPGAPARVLDEQSEFRPDNIYDLTKIAAEQLVQRAIRLGMDAAILRLGRFFYLSYSDYHLRKLSTGLDVSDACQAIVRVLLASSLPRRVYCVASDLPLLRSERARLGIDLPDVLRTALPQLIDAASRAGVPVPDRVGKSVCSEALQNDLGYRPMRTLAWVTNMWSDSTREGIPKLVEQRVRTQFHDPLLRAGPLACLSPGC